MKKFIVLLLASFIAALCLAYTDHETKSVAELFAPGMLVVAGLYALLFAVVVAVLGALRINKALVYGILGLLSVGMAWAFTNPGNNYMLGIAVYAGIFFALLAGIFLLTDKVSHTSIKHSAH